MAVTLRRWAIGTGLGCLVLAAALLPPRGSESLIRYLPWAWFSPYGFWGRQTPVDSLVGEANRLTETLHRASREWLVLSWRDSVLADRKLISKARGGDPEVVVRAQVPPQRVAAIRAAVTQAWQELPRRNPDAWTLVVIIPDSIPEPVGPWLGRFAYNDRFVLFAPLVDDHGCILLLPAGTITGRQPRTTVIDAVLPCAWRAAFGPPSPAVSGWLARSDWMLADGVDWWGEVPSQLRWDSYLYMPDEGGATFFTSQFWYADRLASMALREGRIDVAACFAGQQDACGRSLTASVWNYTNATRLAGLRSSRWADREASVIRIGFLAAMLREAGPDRFQAFWTTTAPLDSVFHDALGTPMDVWAQRLVESRVGRAHWGGLGVGPMLASVLVGLALVGIAVVASSRREVG